MIERIILPTDYSLVGTNGYQKFFNTTTNGVVTLATGVYEFQWLVYLTSTGSAGNSNSANGTFSIPGFGTVGINFYGHIYLGDNVTGIGPLDMNVCMSNDSISASTVVVGSDNTTLLVNARGVFRVNTAGTLNPLFQIAVIGALEADGLDKAKANSSFVVRSLASGTGNYSGDWS